MRRRLEALCRERGSELIEMAIVTPVLLLIVAGIFDFGMMFRSWEVVTNAAREGARVGVLPAFADADVVARVQQYMQASGVANACTQQTPSAGVCPASACSVCVSTQTVPSGAGSFSARYVTVTTRQQLPSLSVIASFFGGNFSSINLTSTSAMRSEIAAGP